MARFNISDVLSIDNTMQLLLILIIISEGKKHQNYVFCIKYVVKNTITSAYELGLTVTIRY